MSLVLDREAVLAAHGLPVFQCPRHSSLAAWTLAATLPEIHVVPNLLSSKQCAPLAGCCVTGLGLQRGSPAGLPVLAVPETNPAHMHPARTVRQGPCCMLGLLLTC